MGNKSLSSVQDSTTREVLIQSGRILFVDDETPLLISELASSGFAVDHDKSGDEYSSQVAAQIYDVAVLDYFGVGQKYGSDQGLDLLRHFRRISPRTRIVAYTSRSLASDVSDFYRLADAVLGKDAGLRESLQIIEDEMRKAFSKEHLFRALLEKLQVTSPQTKKELEKNLVRALEKHDQPAFRKAISKVAGFAAEKGVDILLAKLFMGHS